MFKLYDMNTMSLIDKSYNEKHIIDTLAERINDKRFIYFSIKYHNEELNMDEHYKTIRSVGQYYDYCREYEERQLKDMSCCDLKRSIVKRKKL